MRITGSGAGALVRLAVALVCCGVVGASAAAAEPVRLKVMTFNVWYGGEQVDFQNVIAAIRAADADIVGLQEPDANTRRIAELAGYPYVDLRRHILSRYPLFDPGVGERTADDLPPYSIAGVDADAVAAYAVVAPGRMVAVANTHLTSDPYGPDLARDGKAEAEILANEEATRVPEAAALVAGLKPLVDAGTPVFLTGDFNTPSGHDWTEAAVERRGLARPIDWPVPRLVEAAGFVDSYRRVHPDPAADPGLTWTAGYPHPFLKPNETHDRIDFVWAAHAEPVESAIVGPSDLPGSAVAIDPWPSDHRAVVSTFLVEPVAAPALIAVEPALVAMGQPFLIRVAVPGLGPWGAAVVPRGGDPIHDAVTGISGVSATDRPTIKLSTLGLSPGAYDAVMLDGEGREIRRTRFSIAAAGETATLAVGRPVVAPGEDLAVAWSGAPGFRFDWIGVYRRGAASVYDYLYFGYTGARREGKTVIPAAALPALEPGDYEVRLQLDDGYQTLAVAPFSVKMP